VLTEGQSAVAKVSVTYRKAPKNDPLLYINSVCVCVCVCVITFEMRKCPTIIYMLNTMAIWDPIAIIRT